ncbi:NAD(P)/FAD-dependent oxidoreductase [Nonomuraea aurantiaca]|uniref:NAD(P)/FAD-dependent oxidoreductase n=1 Tax=Nonomuraea aurantiaca TaxID=2878562 RepID=UPI001CDA4D09|nr:FAD-binding oxidoreductase [Nonomuraea aurantiaca]MCA2229335.1 FAD-binding oxidoreductase [Nonomuraea aurantiaca]
MITLDRLVNVLGGYGVPLCGRPETRSAWLRSVAVPDATDRHVTGDLLLAVGTSSIAEAVRWAAAAHAAAVLVRPVETSTATPCASPSAAAEREAAALGDQLGVAVLVADSAVSWSQLVGVVYGLVLESRETASGRGPTDLFALADSLADTISRAVTIEDRHSRVLVYSRSQQAGDPAGRKVIVRSGKGTVLSADAVVLATGVWLPRLARQWGVRVPVRAGRGYSFTVPVDHPVPGPIYLPDVRVACTPYRNGLRVAGTMEFRDPDAPQVPARLGAIVASAQPLLRGVHWDERTDVWVGPRPITPDGRPLIGATKAPSIYVAGGHGMWGLAHGPITGRLLSEHITTGKQPTALADFAPLR